MFFVIFALLTKNQNKSVAVNQFADLCPFIIRKNKVVPRNSDKNIYFLSVLDFMAKAKHLPISSVNVVGFAKVMQHITETALFSRTFPHISVFLGYHHTGTCSRDSTAFHSYLWWLHSNTVQAKHASTRNRTRKREPFRAFRLTMSHNVKKLPLRLRLKAELKKRTCNGAGMETAVQAARVHKLLAASHGSVGCTLCSSTTRHCVVWSGSTHSSGCRAISGTQSAVRCMGFGVRDGCVAQLQRTTCSVPCGTVCEHP